MMPPLYGNVCGSALPLLCAVSLRLIELILLSGAEFVVQFGLTTCCAHDGFRALFEPCLSFSYEFAALKSRKHEGEPRIMKEAT